MAPGFINIFINVCLLGIHISVLLSAKTQFLKYILKLTVQIPDNLSVLPVNAPHSQDDVHGNIK